MNSRTNKKLLIQSIMANLSPLELFESVLLITGCRLPFGDFVKLKKVGGSQPPLSSPFGLMYIAQVVFIGFTKGLMTGIMRVM